MALQEKLDFLDGELRMLQKFCVNSGYNPTEIEKASAPFQEAIKKSHQRKWMTWSIKLILFVGLASCLLYYDPFYKMVISTSRKSTIKLLPYWDWTYLYDTDCLVDNPYYIGHQVTEDDCEACDSLSAIHRVSNVTHADFMDNHIKRDIPIIVTDGLPDTNDRDKYSIKYIAEVYKAHPGLRAYMGCSFTSNIRVRNGNNHAFLQEAAKEITSNYYAHWENCIKPAAKAFRDVYRRPYFLPSIIELSETNWIFLSKGFTGKKYKAVPSSSSLLVLIQFRGEIDIMLSPESICSEVCVQIKDTLREGEILVVPNFLWLTDYLPIGAGENVAVGLGATFD